MRLLQILVLLLLGCKNSENKQSTSPAKPSPTPILGTTAAPNPSISPGTSLTPGKAQRIHFTGSRGDSVAGNLYIPEGASASQKFPALLLEPGINSDSNNSDIAQIAQLFSPQGIAVLTIDFPGTGERAIPGKTKIQDFLTNITADVLAQTVADYGKAVDFLIARPEIDAQRIAYGGASWGAITGIPFVANDPRIKAMIAIVAGGGFFGVFPSAYDPVNSVGRISPRPLFLINAKNDQVILQPFSQALHNAAPTAQKLWLDTDHTLQGVDRNQLLTTMINFLKSSGIM